MSDHPLDLALQILANNSAALRHLTAGVRWDSGWPVDESTGRAMKMLRELSGAEFNPRTPEESDALLDTLMEQCADVFGTARAEGTEGLTTEQAYNAKRLLLVLGDPEIAESVRANTAGHLDVDEFDQFVDDLAARVKARRREHEDNPEPGDIKVDEKRMAAVAADTGLHPSIPGRLRATLRGGEMWKAIARYNATASPANQFILRDEDGFFVSDLRRILAVLKESYSVKNLNDPNSQTRQLLTALAALTH